MIHRRGLILSALALSACGGGGSGDVVTVFAAASLQDVLTEIGAAYEQETGRVARFSFGASSAIARQIEQGAPADVFISADALWMDYLAARNLIAPGTRVDLLGNRLALAAPAGSRLELTVEPGMQIAATLGPDGRLALAAPEVPAGRYAEAALQTLGVWRAVEHRTVRGESVRTALAFVARGEASLGVVYETDARAEPGVRLVGLFPEASHPRIVYPAAVVAGRNTASGEAFLSYLRGPKARAVFARYGFSQP